MGRLSSKAADIWRAVRKYELLLYVIAVSLIAVFLRTFNFGFVSRDYTVFLSKWFTALKEAGGIRGIGKVYGDYSPMYIYFLAIMTHVPLDALVSIKIFSCVFDFILAFYAGLIVRKLRDGSDTAFCFGYTAALFMPAVFLNSAVWGQCDSVFTSFLLMFIYYMMEGKDIPAAVFFGIAFAFKLQTVFLAPVALVALLKGKLRFRALLWGIFAYIACGLPAVFAGMSLFDAYIGAYATQAGEYSSLTLNTPNLYNWIPNMSEENLAAFSNSAIFFAFGAVAAAMLAVYRAEWDDKSLFLICAFFAAFVPFVLPHMHERYWYLSDVLALAAVIAYPKKWFGPFAVMSCSLYVICKYLFGINAIDLSLLALFMAAGVFALGAQLKDALDSVKANGGAESARTRAATLGQR